MWPCGATHSGHITVCNTKHQIELKPERETVKESEKYKQTDGRYRKIGSSSDVSTILLLICLLPVITLHHLVISYIIIIRISRCQEGSVMPVLDLSIRYVLLLLLTLVIAYLSDS